MAETSRDERTEEATPRRLEEAREKGQVALSQELVATLMLAAGMGSLLVGGEVLLARAGALAAGSARSLPALGETEWAVPDAAALVRSALLPVAGAAVASLAVVVAVGWLAGYGQIGLRVAPRAVAIDWTKLDPAKGLGRLFSLRSLVRTLLAGAKVLLITAAVATTAWLQLDELVRGADGELGPQLGALLVVATRCGAAGLAAIALLAAVDLWFQRRQHGRDLRMTKEEVKEEHKTSEGDPHVRARVRSLQREMAARRMMADVPKATVVVTNPTHFAVALLYERDAEGRPGPAAPVVVAKGRDRVALRIRELAQEAGVLCYEDPPLARSLYAQVEVGQEIPEGLYAAVAVVLGYVYKRQEEKARAR